MKKSQRDLRVLFWNVKDFGKRSDNGQDEAYEDRRLRAIMQIVQNEKADIACFAEVVDPEIKTRMAKVLPLGYTIVESAGKSQHKLVTIFKNAATHNVTVSHRKELQRESEKGRAFPLVEVDNGSRKIAIMPVHTKSGSSPENFRIRKSTMQQIASVAAALEKQQIPFMILGDMNTMGNSGDITSADEIRKTRYMLYDPTQDKHYSDWEAGHLSILPKDHPFTWKGIGHDNQYDDANFDHVFLSDPYEDVPDDERPIVQVKGWPECPTEQEQEQWVKDFSDHAYLVVDIKNFKPAP